jgi:catechol 2,3-dioxygenase-like lactoylglutathione lyase family enzyme
MKDPQKTLRALYKRLILLYPRGFRELLGESMAQTFGDLCDEDPARSGLGWAVFGMWVFLDTSAGILREWLNVLRQGNRGKRRKGKMEIRYASVLVDDQEKALQFYTEKLGFVKQGDVMDGPWRCLTIASKDGPDFITLELQGMNFPSARAYQQEQYEAEYAYTAFPTQDIYAEYSHLKQLGVVFRGEPEDAGPVLTVKFEDTCGNLINLIQVKE